MPRSVGERVAEHRRRQRAAGMISVSVVVPPVSYTHLRAHETVLDLVCRLLLEKKKTDNKKKEKTKKKQ